MKKKILTGMEQFLTGRGDYFIRKMSKVRLICYTKTQSLEPGYIESTIHVSHDAAHCIKIANIK